MDNGEEIQGLDDGWTFMGAKVSEWSAGIAVFIIVGEVFFKRRYNIGIPFMMISAIFTVLSLVRIRKTFPDEERGIINSCCITFGFAPPGIPTPSEFRDHWSGVPCSKLDQKSEFVKLGLDEIFFPEHEEKD